MPRVRHLIVRSRNTSCRPLKQIETGDKRVIYRMGSITNTNTITKRNVDLEINKPEACLCSSSKISMKQAFDEWNHINCSTEETKDNKIPTAKWYILNDIVDENVSLDKFPYIIKKYNSSKGNGIYKVDTQEELDNFINDNINSLHKFIIEEWLSYSREYRLHVTKDGCFYTCRKMLKNDATDRWHRHESNSVWVMDTNELFDKPSNWDDVVNSCINAMKAVGLDIAAVDVKIQNNTHEKPKFIILETNSAPALGEIGIAKYKEKLEQIISE